MKLSLWLLFVTIQAADAQKLKKTDKAILANLEQHINYLANDKLEGRRTGTIGEKLAYEYISKQFQEARAIYKQIVERYGDTKQATVARQQIENLRNA